MRGNVFDNVIIKLDRNLFSAIFPASDPTKTAFAPAQNYRCFFAVCASFFSNFPAFTETRYDTNGNNPNPSGTTSPAGLVLCSKAGGMESSVLAFDVGGSHVAAAVCRAADYRLGPVASAPHKTIHTSDAFIELLHDLGVQAGAGDEGVIGAMLAVPGPFDLGSGVSLMRHKLPYLYGVDLRKTLAARFGWQPSQVHFLNDADAYLLGEIGAGAARGFQRAVGLTLGTGIGSAFAVDGSLVTTGPGVPKGGEIWNLPYRGGIVEDFISSRAIVGNYKRRTGAKREVVDLAAAASSDIAAAEAFEAFGQHLGEVIRTLLADFHADVIVLGGGISRSPQLFLPAVRVEAGDSPTQLRISELKDTAALVGCGVAAFRSGNEAPDAGKSVPISESAI